MTAAMEKVTTNYLEGEQRICDSWANYIRSREMTLQEATDFVGAALTSEEICAHLLLTNNGALEGLSTTPRTTDQADFAVSYADLNVLDNWMDGAIESAQMLNITRAYTNQTNGVQSIAFYNTIKVIEGSALLLRVVPVSMLEGKWVFPTDEYQNTEISTIDADGNYIIKSRSLKNASFYEFYKSSRVVDYST